MKSKEELKALKKEYKEFNKKCAELSEKELQQVAGGYIQPCNIRMSHAYTKCVYSEDYIRTRILGRRDTECILCEKNYVLWD